MKELYSKMFIKKLFITEKLAGTAKQGVLGEY